MFSNVTIIPKGRFLKLTGSIRNIPIVSANSANILLRGVDRNSFLKVKRKRKFSYCRHVYFKAVGPDRLNTLGLIIL